MQLPRSYTRFHDRLFKICLGTVTLPPAEEYIKKVEQSSRCNAVETAGLSIEDLHRMARMVELEFLASFEKELEMPGDSVGKKKSDPNIFDVFLMESTLQRRGRRQVALCIAIKGRPGENSMMWYDGESFVPLHMWQHCRKLASLSGSARVLQALDENPDDPDLELMKCCMNRDGLITASEFDNSSVVHYDPSIAESMNKSQKQALNAIASPSFNKGFLAIQGPPGCGKTTTIVGMISAVGKNVIVTAPSNAAVANVALKLFETGRYNTHEIAVFGENCDESVHFLNPFWRCQRFQVFRRQLDAIADSHDLSDSSKTAERFQVCDAFAAFLRLGRLDLVDEDSIEVFLNKVNLLCPFVDKESDTGRKQFQKLLASSKVVFCTLNTSGSMFFKKALQGRFDTLMLDEGGQCSEAEFYIACTFPRLQRIIVVGDPKQLGATVIDHTCKKEGFGESWLDKIYKLYPQQIHLLDTQYRLDPKILLFPNHRFYRNRIKSGENVHDRSPKIEHPLRFVDASGRGREEREDYSWKNAYEAAMIKNILKNDYDVVNLLASDPFARIIIITPYRAQEKLLRETLDASVGITNIEVSTVDKVQGQERDIVVISTVRTKDVGFVDDRHRINVALTRAKRVLRVVGDVSFFKTLPVRSTLRALAEFCEQRGHIQKSDVRAIAWCPPDWKQSTLWKPTSTARFIHCLRAMSEAQRNVCLNTLFSVALPDLSALNAPDIKQRDRPTWIMSRLRGERVRLNIVWIAKRLHGGLCIQAHFAGDRDACLNFIQRSPELPDGACQVRKDLSGILEPIDDKKTTTTTRFVMSWPLTNELQTNLSTEAGLSRSLLPQGRLILDDTQERVARSTPPLLIESRSGTGKTLVLLQHAAFFARANRDSPACFVTVSPRLRDELYERYKEIGSVENPERENTMGLPPTQFYSFRRLLSELAEWRGMKIFSESENCSSFLEYCDARRSYKKVLIETGLIDNEIGGVIMGSLAAAKQRRPLDRDQYLADKRSNVSTKSEQGKQTKNAIYDEYKRYQAWKVKERKFDVADIVLSLLGEDLDQIFSSAYLDEVQDLSHAAIYLICSIAGKDSLHWVCAGDPAQMISPGCSFTFNGLKQTLLAVQSGIESKLSSVTHLLVNYRTTKDILLVGNAVLQIAKQTFPDAIEHAQQETSKKDLGLKVVLCDWDEAFSCKVAFGGNQAYIFSSDRNSSSGFNAGEPSKSVNVLDRATEWLQDHPFILSSLESKGLEFEDVLIAFDFDRKVWDLSRKRMDTLRMLRELYVAITRAQRRVVILCRKNVSTMVDFFEHLPYQFEKMCANEILDEFDRQTTPTMWFQRGQDLRNKGQYMVAARCFTKAKAFGWSSWSEGQFQYEKGRRNNAVAAFRQALRFFAEDSECARILEIVSVMIGIPPWDPADDSIVDIALAKLPSQLSSKERVKLALVRNRWKDVSINDLLSSETKDFFSNHRSNKHLNNLVRACSESERRDLESLHPLLVGDYHFENGEFLVATRFFLFGDDKKKAELATVSWIKDATRPKYGESLPQEIDTVVGLWKEERAFVQREYPNSDLNTLLEIFLSEMSLAEISKSLKTKFSILFGRRFILHLVNYRSLSQLDLYHFGDSEFDTEIFAALQSIHCNCPVESIFFFINHNDKRKASDFALKVLKPLGESAVIRSLIELRMTPTRLFRESEVRKQLDAFVRISLDATSMGTRDREEFCQQYVSPEIRTGIIPTTVRYCLKSGHSELALDLSVRELAACGAGDAIWVASIVESWLRSDTWHSSLLDSRQVASPQPSATTKQITQSNGDAGRGKKNGRKQNKRNRKVREKAVQSSKENAHGSADDKRLNRRTNDMIRKDAQSWLLLLLREPCYQKSGEVVIRAKFGQGFGTFMHLHDFRKSDPVLLRSLLSLADDLNACLTSKFEEVISYPETVGAEGKNHPYSDFRLALSKKFGFAVAAHLECFQPSVGKAGNLSLSTLRRFYRDLKLRLRNRDGQALEMFKQELKASLSQHRRDDDNWHYRDARLSLLLVFPSAEADFLWWQQVQNDGHPNARSWSCIEFHQILKRFKTFHQELQTALRAQEEKILGDMVKERKEKKISLVKTLSQNQGATIEGKKPLDSMAKISKTPRQTKNPPSKDWFEDTCNVQAGDMSTVTRDAPSAASRRKRKKSKKKK